MRRSGLRILAWTMLVPAGGLILIGILCWPPGGLLFALPYLFLIPGCLLGLVGLILLGLSFLCKKQPDRERP